MKYYKGKPEYDEYQALETSYDQKMLKSTGTYDYDYLIQTQNS